MKHTKEAMEALRRAKGFVHVGIDQILQNSLDEEHGVSVSPGATALAALSLSVLGRGYEEAQKQGTDWLLKHRNGRGWGKIPGALPDEEVTRLALLPVQLNRGGIWSKLSVFEHVRQLSALVLTLGKDVVPGLEGPTPEEITLPHILEERVLKKLPPYGRPVVVAACLLAASPTTQGLEEGIQFLKAWQMPDGSWAEDVVATSLGILALARFPGLQEITNRAGHWLVLKQYKSGGWPAFDQLQTWVMGWMGAIYQELELTSEEKRQMRDIQKWLFRARNRDGSFGTTPPYTHPDLDDTAVALMALSAHHNLQNPTLRILLQLQNEDGSWGTFPEFTGQPPEIKACAPVYIQSVDVTLHILEAMRRQGLLLRHPAARKGLQWVLSQQQKDGAFNAVWFEGPIYSSAQALELMTTLHYSWSQWVGFPRVSQYRQKTLLYLLGNQNTNGGWGTSMVETALTLSALLPLRNRVSPDVFERGISDLLGRQAINGAFRPDFRGIYAKGWNYEEPMSTTLTGIRALERYLRQ